MKIQTFSVKAIVKGSQVEVDHTKKVLTSDGENTHFDEGKIAFKAQEVAEFNRKETEVIKSMGDGEYTIDFQLIV
jgi:hypothetical protein